jgi:outer membrane protein OmpA-like peptidoglycan-associated protein/LysM repeat protein
MCNGLAGTKVASLAVVIVLAAFVSGCATPQQKEARRQQQLEEMQKKFSWWGKTGATPAPVKDEQRGGYWWWPKSGGQPDKVWGNGGYVYLRTIFDYKSDELPPAKAGEMRPSLLVKKIVKNVKIYFDFDKAHLRKDAKPILEDAVQALNKSPETTILISGNCDIRGTEKYNDKLGRKRADAVKKYMIEQGIPEERIKIVSRGKLDAVAPVTDLLGMAKDRNAQFMVAEVQEVMLPAPETVTAAGQTEQPMEVQVPPDAKVEEGKYVTETTQELESQIKVGTKEYTVKKGDTLWTIAQSQLGSGHRWKYLADVNKDRVKNPNKLKPGQKIIIPVE